LHLSGSETIGSFGNGSGARYKIDPELYLANGRETRYVLGKYLGEILNNRDFEDLLPFGFLINDLG
jgi:hypothetical protein